MCGRQAARQKAVNRKEERAAHKRKAPPLAAARQQFHERWEVGAGAYERHMVLPQVVHCAQCGAQECAKEAKSVRGAERCAAKSAAGRKVWNG